MSYARTRTRFLAGIIDKEEATHELYKEYDAASLSRRVVELMHIIASKNAQLDAYEAHAQAPRLERGIVAELIDKMFAMGEISEYLAIEHHVHEGMPEHVADAHIAKVGSDEKERQARLQARAERAEFVELCVQDTLDQLNKPFEEAVREAYRRTELGNRPTYPDCDNECDTCPNTECFIRHKLF